MSQTSQRKQPNSPHEGRLHVEAAQGAIEKNEEESELLVNTSAGSVNIIAEEVEAREAVYKMEKQLRDAQRRLEGVHRKKYNKNRGTDSETDQSG